MADTNNGSCTKGAVVWLLLVFLVTSSGIAFAQMPVNSDNAGKSSGGNDDPTALTIKALEAAIANLEKTINQRFDITDRLNEENFKASDRLTSEKFKGVDQQFAGRDVALAAALLAQKTSVDEQNKTNAAAGSKSEAAITKQIDGIQVLITTMTKATDDKITDLRDRLTQREGETKGMGDLWGWVAAAIGMAIGVMAVIDRMRPHPA